VSISVGTYIGHNSVEFIFFTEILQTGHLKMLLKVSTGMVWHETPHFGRLRSSKVWNALRVSQGLATVCIYIRSIFRVAELSGGFNGYLANNEIIFTVIEGAMIFIAAICLSTIGHPGIGFQKTMVKA
jgi:hypothetical protein